jgi:hypothetical protein
MAGHSLFSLQKAGKKSKSRIQRYLFFCPRKGSYYPCWISRKRNVPREPYWSDQRLNLVIFLLLASIDTCLLMNWSSLGLWFTQSESPCDVGHPFPLYICSAKGACYSLQLKVGPTYLLFVWINHPTFLLSFHKSVGRMRIVMVELMYG